MSADWKDALAALRGNLNEPESNSDISLENEVENDTESLNQKNKLTVLTDKKGRNGKIATIIEGFEIPQTQVEDIARKLKQKLGTGGSVRDGEILIQGDYKIKVAEYLKSLNFKIRII